MHVAIVTGSTRNIGRAIARRLAREGVGVAINGRDAEASEAVAQDIRAEGGHSVAAPGDVTDEDAVAAIIDRTAERLGPVDILVNNAVGRFHAPITESALADWRRALAIVLDGAFLCTRAVLPAMRERGWGRVINIAGVSGQTGAANRSAAVTAKSGILGFTKALALETASDGITVNAVSPGIIDTERAVPPGREEATRERYRQELQRVPLGRFGTVDEIAGACAYLCSEEAAFITGQTLGVNGGLHM